MTPQKETETNSLTGYLHRSLPPGILPRMLQVSGLHKSFAGRVLFDDVTFSLTSGERIALIGRNGCGKSTLFKLILGQEHPDAGEITAPRGYRIGHLAQHLSFTKSNILQEACAGLLVQDGSEDYKAEVILSGLGFSMADLGKPASEFSGGYQIRVELARVLVSEPDLLLLDEPTNYLDIVSVRWLERFLRSWKSELVVISHDREFLDAISTHTMIIKRRDVRKIEGGTEKLYQQLMQDDAVYEKTRENLAARRKQVQEFVDKFKAKAGTAAMAQSRMKELERMPELEELEQEQDLGFRFVPDTFPGKTMIELRQMSFDYQDEQARGDRMPLIKDFDYRVGREDRIGVIGKNGKGKSTLLRLLAGELKAVSGEVAASPNISEGYFGQTNIQRLSGDLTVEQEVQSVNERLSRTAVRAICGALMFSGDDALKKVRILSGGEKSRVLLAKILARPANLLLLDEPSNHLDLQSVDSLIEALEEFPGAVVVVTHNERILRRLCNRLIVFQGSGPVAVEGNYEYFLDSIGWEEEADEPGIRSNRNRKEKQGAKEERRLRAKQREERSKLMGPLEKESKTLESKIVTLEKAVAVADKELIEASQAGDSSRITALSKQAAEGRAEIEKLFDRLSQVDQQLREAEKSLGSEE